MGTQVPKGLGLGVLVVGTPLILWSAADTNLQLDTLNTETSSREVRIERCVKLADQYGADRRDQLPLCECVVDKASERGIQTSYGGYEEAGVEAVIKSCTWQLGL